MLELEQKACHLAKSMSINTEHHGSDDVGAIDIVFDGVMLNANEIDNLLGNGSHKALFNYPPPRDKQSAMPTVRFPHFLPLGLNHKFKDANVILRVGMKPDKLDFFECKISGIRLTPQEGGLVSMKCSIRARPESDDVAKLFDHRNTDATIWIRDAEKVDEPNANQQSLGLGEKQDDEEGDRPVH
jgi:hypothetical protein